MGKIQNMGKGIPHELNESQQETQKTTFVLLLTRYKIKSFLHQIFTGNEECNYFKNPKKKRSWLTPGKSSISNAKSNHYSWKTMLCVCWDQKVLIYYELQKPVKTINAECY